MKTLRFGGWKDVPRYVAVCPECGHPLVVRCNEWLPVSGEPVALRVECAARHNEHLLSERDWKQTKVAVENWAGRNDH